MQETLDMDFKDRDGNYILRFRLGGQFIQTRLGKLHNNMTQRAKGAHDKFKSHYVGVTMSALFADPQAFCQWAVAQPGWGHGYHLDKDLLGNGAKMYSEDNCVFLPQVLNTLIGTKLAKSTFVSAGKWRVRTKTSGGVLTTIYSETEEKSREAARVCRILRIRELADQYRETLDPRAYAALMAWEPKA